MYVIRLESYGMGIKGTTYGPYNTKEEALVTAENMEIRLEEEFDSIQYLKQIKNGYILKDRKGNVLFNIFIEELKSFVEDGLLFY